MLKTQITRCKFRNLVNSPNEYHIFPRFCINVSIYSIKSLIKDSLNHNCKSTEIGKWEPFRSRAIKKLYFDDNLDMDKLEDLSNDDFSE
jgi:hypothetical protein